MIRSFPRDFHTSRTVYTLTRCCYDWFSHLSDHVLTAVSHGFVWTDVCDFRTWRKMHTILLTRFRHITHVITCKTHVIVFRRARRVLRSRPKRREVWWLSLVPEEGYFSPYRSPLLLSRCLAHAHDSPFSSTCNETLLSRWTFWSSFEKVPALALVQLKSFS